MNTNDTIMPTHCDWCGKRSAKLAIRATIDGSHGDGRGYDILCPSCVRRYNQEAREYRERMARTAR